MLSLTLLALFGPDLPTSVTAKVFGIAELDFLTTSEPPLLTSERPQLIGPLDLDAIAAGSSENLFFIETNDTLREFHPRLVCAFESAARQNPTQKVSF